MDQNMKNKSYMLTALAVCIGLLLTIFLAGLLESSATLSFSGAMQQSPTRTYAYIISVSGSKYQMIDGTTGQIVSQSTNSSQVFSNVVGNCSVGAIIEVESGVYTVTTSWTIFGINDVNVNFESGAMLVAADNLNAPITAKII